ncbi:DUF1871 family protein [Metabacillus sediminilitoris]|uniref:DUF1871 family protein n=1 Tax=Metabacillus sediminilitoris TaxID=2567941 RepID=A0A4S4C0S5_9BACI|nr:DUF1871 family protein [Metabacillus sediminilitoris]QGQ47823.1 DUF1871 family protein [Metabacillus sediminilitoris]THF81064.1 DUF1871 family protein [Metabacillus sediminilitoris]
MEAQQTNIQLMEILFKWDPLGYGEGSYDTEIVDVLQAVHIYDDEILLARKIQAIYEFSFEEIIPLKKCEKLSKQLLFIKNNSSCEI